MIVRPWTFCLGKDTICSMLVSNLHPSWEIQRIVNPRPKQRVINLIATRCAIITHGTLMFEATFTFMSPSSPDLELHSARKTTVISAEGFNDHFWMTVLLASC